MGIVSIINCYRIYNIQTRIIVQDVYSSDRQRPADDFETEEGSIVLKKLVTDKVYWSSRNYLDIKSCGSKQRSK